MKDALNEAMRDWVTNVDDTFYIIGTVAGPHPYPMIVRDFNSIVGKEVLRQFHEVGDTKYPDFIVACVGGGSNALGIFYPFIDNNHVQLIGVEAGGNGINTGKHASTLCAGKKGVLHGNRTYILQDNDGQIVETHSISAGLDYPGVGPEHSYWKDSGRVNYLECGDDAAMSAFDQLARTEGIIAALESSHAIAKALELAGTMARDQHLLVCLSGRGDKDAMEIARLRGEDW